MRIGINTIFLFPGKRGGILFYTACLIEELSRIDKDNEYVIFTNRQNHDFFKAHGNNFSKQLCLFSPENNILRVIYEQLFLPLYIRKWKIDVMHSTGGVVPVLARCSRVVTICDMQYRHFRDSFNGIKLFFLHTLLPLSAKLADKIITISENSKRDITSMLNVSPQKVVVTHLASKFSSEDRPSEVNGALFFKKQGIGEEYILSVGSIVPHKNFERLIRSYALIQGKTKAQLVIAGLKLQGFPAVEKMLEENVIDLGRVVFTGYVSDEDLALLYSKARLFVFPSLFEGFGIPLLEAMSLGCPVAASNTTSVPEVVGDAAVLFDPKDSQDIANAVYSIISNDALRRGLVKRGYERGLAFSWRDTALKTIDVYKEAYHAKQNKLSREVRV